MNINSSLVKRLEDWVSSGWSLLSNFDKFAVKLVKQLKSDCGTIDKQIHSYTKNDCINEMPKSG